MKKKNHISIAFKIEEELKHAIELHCEYTRTDRAAFCRELLIQYLISKGVLGKYNNVIGEWGRPTPPRKSKNGEKSKPRNFGENRKWVWDGTKVENPRTIGVPLSVLPSFPLYNATINWVVSKQDEKAPSVTGLFRYLINKEMHLLGYYDKKGRETAKLRELSDNLQRVAA